MKYKKHHSITMIASGLICLILILCCAVKLNGTNAAAVGSDDSSSIVSSADTEDLSNKKIEVEFPVTLSAGTITIDKDDTYIQMHAGQAAALSDEDIAIINACPQVCSITMLGANSEDLNRLTLLDNITKLYLGSCSETDLSPLASIRHLESLELSACNCIVDFSFLAQCYELKTLRIYDCYDINNHSIKGIASADTLKTLFLEHLYNVTDVSPIGQLENLETLYLTHPGRTTDFSAISQLENLREFYLCGADIDNIDFLSPMVNLKRLEIAYCRISDETGFNTRKIEDLSPLATMTDLEYLHIAGMDAKDISVLSSLTNLTELYINFVNISDLTPLYGLAKLERASIVDTKCTDSDFEKLQEALPDCELITEGLG